MYFTILNVFIQHTDINIIVNFRLVFTILSRILGFHLHAMRYSPELMHRNEQDLKQAF